MSRKTKTSDPKLELTPKIEARWEPDYDSQPDHLGHYATKWEEGAVERAKYRSIGSNECDYWISTNYAKFSPDDYRHLSGKEKRDLIKKHGSLENYHKYCRLQDYERHEAFERGEWSFYSCEVTVSIGSLAASTALYGIDAEPDDPYRKDVEESLAGEAIVELKEKVVARLEVE